MGIHHQQEFYVSADVGGGDAKEMVHDAKDHGYALLLPDFAGMSMEDVVENLEAMNLRGGNYSNQVWIFDTLKKMADVISKGSLKKLLKLMRALSAKGMTIVLLGHANKYKDSDGNPIYEGTVDLRTDVDELVYFIPDKHEDGSMTVSTIPDKVRAALKPMTFEISPDRDVTLAEEYIDTKTERQKRFQREEDESVIEAVKDAIANQKGNESAIIEHCRSVLGAGRKTLVRVLKAYNHEEWEMRRGFQNNAKRYYLPDEKWVQCQK